ncbi:MAG: 3-oxoacyl-[acyl-carrier-protein] reductase [Pseudomonadota bacterium]
MGESSRVVAITGGSRGIGRAVALKFAQEQATIIIAHYDPDETASGETLTILSQKGIKAESYKADVSSHSEVDALFKGVISRHGRIDALINNAGIVKDTLLMRMTEEDWDRVIDVNLKGVFNCTHAVIRAMMKQRQGCVVNISSVSGNIGNVGQANYAASKAGILGFTKTVAREVASRGITVNAVAPGFIATEMSLSLSEKAQEAILQQIPMGRVGTPEDVAGAVYWLCSNEAKFITGQTIHVNGGMYMS